VKDLTVRKVRGGGWSTGGSACQAALRQWSPLGGRRDAPGFRLVRGPIREQPGKPVPQPAQPQDGPAQATDKSPPTIVVDADYPGADAMVVRDSVAAPIEQQVKGVESSLHLASRCSNDGKYVLVVTFKPGTDLDRARVLVKKRVALALPALP